MCCYLEWEGSRKKGASSVWFWDPFDIRTDGFYVSFSWSFIHSFDQVGRWFSFCIRERRYVRTEVPIILSIFISFFLHFFQTLVVPGGKVCCMRELENHTKRDRQNNMSAPKLQSRTLNSLSLTHSLTHSLTLSYTHAPKTNGC